MLSDIVTEIYINILDYVRGLGFIFDKKAFFQFEVNY